MHNIPNPLLIGIDLGGTKIQVAATDFSGRVLARLREPTPRSLPAGLDLLRQALTTVSDGGDIIDNVNAVSKVSAVRPQFQMHQNACRVNCHEIHHPQSCVR